MGAFPPSRSGGFIEAKTSYCRIQKIKAHTLRPRCSYTKKHPSKSSQTAFDGRVLSLIHFFVTTPIGAKNRLAVDHHFFFDFHSDAAIFDDHQTFRNIDQHIGFFLGI